jgi:hypothetical protein
MLDACVFALPNNSEIATTTGAVTSPMRVFDTDCLAKVRLSSLDRAEEVNGTCKKTARSVQNLCIVNSNLKKFGMPAQTTKSR